LNIREFLDINPSYKTSDNIVVASVVDFISILYFGFNETAILEIRNVLPNASYILFTLTPDVTNYTEEIYLVLARWYTLLSTLPEKLRRYPQFVKDPQSCVSISA
jgi:hypothetical protein